MQSILGLGKPLLNVLTEAAVSRVLSLEALRTLHTTNRLNMPIKVGDKIPSVELYENTPTNKVNIAKICEGKKVVLFAVPGAFTPGCSQTHLPGYISDADNLKAKGISEVICVSVNDPFVMAAWAKDQKTEGKIRLLADPAGAFAKAVDLTTDLPPLGGLRSKRYSMLIDNCTVSELNVEPDGTGLSCSLSKNLKVA